MFTGLVQGRGIVQDVRPEGVEHGPAAPGASPVCESPSREADAASESFAPALRLSIRCPDDFGRDGEIGESVAMNGCCLTAVAVEGTLWSFQAGSETLSKTNLGRLKAGDPVNLERALPADGRLGGHFVQGHIDGVGHVDRTDREGDWVTMWFRAGAALVAQLVPKGSVAVDGVSLTVVDLESDRFSVALIPHTLETTTLGIRRPGDPVNIETDILGKYVRRFLKT